MASDDQTDIWDQEPTSAKALQIIGAFLGGNSGRPVGSGLMALGNMMGMNAYKQYEAANRPNVLKGLGIDDKDPRYQPLMGLSYQDFEQIKPHIEEQVFAKPDKPTEFQEYQRNPDLFAKFEQAKQKPAGPSAFQQELQLYQQNPGLYREFKLAGDKPDKPDKPSELQEKIELFRNDPNLYRQMFGGDKPGAVQWRTETDPNTGRTVQVPYQKDPASGALVRVPIAGESSGTIPSRLNEMEQKQIDSINSVGAMVPSLKDTINSLPDASPTKMATEYAKYRAPFGALGAADPAYSAYFNQLGQIQTDLIQAAMGGSRAVRLAEWLKPHIPSPTDPPARAMEKLNGFDQNRFKALRQTLLGTSTPDSGASPTPAIPPPPPGFK